VIQLDSRVPDGPIAEKWDNHKFDVKLVNPSNKRKFHILVVGSGLAGASAAASLGELGYNVLNFCIQDSPRRAHSIAALLDRDVVVQPGRLPRGNVEVRAGPGSR